MRKSHLRQVLLLTLVTTLFTAPFLLRDGTGPVAKTYEGAAKLFWRGETPYLAPTWDWFKYSPFFAFLYTPFSWLPSSPQALIWGMFNALVFWWGITLWAPLSKQAPKALWAGVILASMELDGSVRYQQVNGLLAGMMLIAAARVRDGRLVSGGSWLAYATNFKLIPVFLLTAFPTKRTLWKGILLASIVCVAVPAIFLGPVKAFEWHAQWARLILNDMGSEGLSDIYTLMAKAGHETLGKAIKYAVFLLTLAGAPLVARRHLDLAVAMVLTMLVLVSPRTESATFVVAAPAFVLLARTGKPWFFALVLLCAFFTTISFNDIWPKAIWRADGHLPKALGVLGLWALSWLGAFLGLGSNLPIDGRFSHFLQNGVRLGKGPAPEESIVRG